MNAAAPTPEVRPAEGYAGDVAPELAWRWWQDGHAVLVDVRSDAEREWVGYVPGAVPVAWKQWPGMAMNPGFDQALREAVAPGGPCRACASAWPRPASARPAARTSR
jgi:hypothetical protein